jgi:hypothetical protein
LIFVLRLKKKKAKKVTLYFLEKEREKKKGPQGQTVLLSLTCAISKEKGCDDASNNMMERVCLTIERLYTCRSKGVGASYALACGLHALLAF